MRTTNIFHRFHFYCSTRYRCPHSNLGFLPTRFLLARLVDLNFHVIVRFSLLVSARNVESLLAFVCTPHFQSFSCSHLQCCLVRRKSAYDLLEIKNRIHKQSHKRDRVGVGRIRTFPFSYDSVVYDLVVKTKSESVAEVEG